MRLPTLLVTVFLSLLTAARALASSTGVLWPTVLPGQVYLLTVATGETVEVPYAEPPGCQGPPTVPEAGTTERPLPGWVVTVAQTAGAEAGTLPAEPTEAILVPWGYGANCRPTRWPGDREWLRATERGVVSAYPRPRSAWMGGRPVLDVFLAWHQPYPSGKFLEFELRRTPAPDPVWLTTDEYWSLVRAFPTLERARTDPERAGEALRAWVRAHPILARRFPAHKLLWDARTRSLVN